MKKLSTNEWVAVIVSLGVAFFILFFSFHNSPMFKGNPDNLEASIIKTGENLVDINDIQMQEITPGTGKEARLGSKIKVNYSGFLTDGTKFDSSLDRGVPFEFILGNGEVIEGWDKGILGMKEGGTRKLTIPPALAYGENQQGPIPPNSTLVFFVELLEVVD